MKIRHSMLNLFDVLESFVNLDEKKQWIKPELTSKLVRPEAVLTQLYRQLYEQSNKDCPKQLL